MDNLKSLVIKNKSLKNTKETRVYARENYLFSRSGKGYKKKDGLRNYKISRALKCRRATLTQTKANIIEVDFAEKELPDPRVF